MRSAVAVLLILLCLVAAACLAAEAAQPVAGAPGAAPQGDLAQRYGPYGIIAGLLSLITWAFKQLFNHLRKVAYILTRLVEILSERKCLAADDRMAHLRELKVTPEDLTEDGG